MAALEATCGARCRAAVLLALLLLFVADLLGPVPASAQWARLLLDARGTDDSLFDSAPGVRIGDQLLFPGRDTSSGPSDIWRTDGTSEGTVVAVSGEAAGFGSAGSVWGGGSGYFVFWGSGGLWRSDGTDAGTLFLNEVDACPGSRFAASGGQVFFCGYDSAHHWELWRTDGTVAGTTLVKDINPGGGDLDFSYPNQLTDVNGTLFFMAIEEATGEELWKSDGTEAGTMLVKDIEPGFSSSYPNSLTNLGGTLFFETASGAKQGLWKSDGSEAGTVPVRLSSDSFWSPDWLTEVSGGLFFVAHDTVHGQELWRSDGTERGTVLVKDISPTDANCLDQDWTVGLYGTPIARLGDVAVFRTDDGVHGCELWRSDGTPLGTSLVRDISPQGSSRPTRFHEAHGLLYFQADDGVRGAELWRTDGTADGTVLVHDSNPLSGPSNPSVMDVLGPLVIFDAEDQAHGREPWRTDGSSAGTWILRDINTSNRGSFPVELSASGGTLFFAADDGISGYEPWKSDGSESGTVVVKDLAPAHWSSNPANLMDVSTQLFFTAERPGMERSLWRSDGIEAGTVLVRQFGRELFGTTLDHYPWDAAAVGDVLFFLAENTNSGSPELWKSDGTEAGTVMLHEGSFSELTALGDLLMFAGGELWRSDGTQAGTQVVLDIRLEGNSDPAELAAVGDKLYFSADDGVHGRELWLSNGHASGTALVRDIRPDGSSSPRDLMANAGRLFFVAHGGTAGEELWQSDGSVQGTSQVRDIHPTRSSSPENLLAAGGLLYFLADDGSHGTELWVSDGSESGTHLVKDISSGSAGCDCRLGVVFDGRLFFSADDGIHGMELWTSDGTEVGTWMLQDVRGGEESSWPQKHTVIDEQVFFSADDGLHGHELWVGEAWIEPRNLWLSLEGDGLGLVTSVPAGIYCGADCLEGYPFATSVGLNANPTDESSFGGWGGDPDCLDGALTMVGPRYCSARFDACVAPAEVHLENETISDQRSVTACNRLYVGPACHLTAAADVTLRAGEIVVFVSDVVIEEGAQLKVSTGSP